MNFLPDFLKKMRGGKTKEAPVVESESYILRRLIVEYRSLVEELQREILLYNATLDNHIYPERPSLPLLVFAQNDNSSMESKQGDLGQFLHSTMLKYEQHLNESDKFKEKMKIVLHYINEDILTLKLMLEVMVDATNSADKNPHDLINRLNIFQDSMRSNQKALASSL